MIDHDKLEQLIKLTEHFEHRRARASERLAFVGTNAYCFAILALQGALDEYRFDKFATLRGVSEPPGEVELGGAIHDKGLMSAVARYSHSIRYELAVNVEIGNKHQSAFDLAWWIISALRVKTLADVLVPAVSDHSWSTIAGLSEDSCHIQLLEDVPKARRFGPDVQVTAADLDWVYSNLLSWGKLLENAAFRLAVESATTHQHHASLRMATAALWAGIEALFSVTAELRFRLATLAASFLEARGPSRLEQYRTIKKLYDFRSKAVHGSPVSDADLELHVIQVRQLLSRLLCKIVEAGDVPSLDDFDTHVFC